MEISKRTRQMVNAAHGEKGLKEGGRVKDDYCHGREVRRNGGDEVLASKKGGRIKMHELKGVHHCR